LAEKTKVEDVFEALTWALLLGLVWFVAPPLVAYRKGYPSAPWFCALGLAGVFALAFFPFLDHGESLAERQRLTVRATRVGWLLSVVGFLACFGCYLSTTPPGDQRLISFLLFVGFCALVRMVRGPSR
jgi:hypothetical protein